MRRLIPLLAVLLLAGSAAAAQPKPFAPLDRFAAATDELPLAVDEQALFSSRGAWVDHREPRLGVPTFLWGKGEAGSSSAEKAARGHLQALADVYRLSPADAAAARVVAVHDTGRGAVIVRFDSVVAGIEVFRNQLNVVMDPDLGLVAISGYLAPSATQASRAPFVLAPEEAIAAAFRDLTGKATEAKAWKERERRENDRWFELGAALPAGWEMPVPARARQVWFGLADRLEPGWYVELALDDRATGSSAWRSFVVSAADGSLLFRNELVAHASYTYRVWAEPWSFLPHDSPFGTDPSPHPTGLPDGYRPPVVPSNLVTLRNLPFSRNDPWLPANASSTVGNNVDAYADRGAPDGYQPGVDFRAPTTGPSSFDHLYDHAMGPGATAAQRDASVVSLFYANNFFHDWYYDAGFDERWGNAQQSNYGRGGREGDRLKAEALDYAGRNNANMATPADGAPPRMQMFVFDGKPLLRVTAPGSLAGSQPTASASFGPAAFDLAGELAVPNPAGTTLGCSAFAPGTFAGRIALLDRGTCPYADKVLNAQQAGALAVVIVDNVDGHAAPAMGGVGSPTIPVLSTTQAVGNGWKAHLQGGGAAIQLAMRRGPSLDRDSALDMGIVAHEWGHFISNRLIGDANGLTNNQGRALGEGWGDFHALLLLVRPEDVNRPGNSNFQGVYSIAGYATDDSYFGIRRVPYSTDLNRNALTFRHIENGTPLPTHHPVAFSAPNSQVHASGEVWATMLWEAYASLLRAHPFEEARERMKYYLVAAYKATPISPTFLEARDALVAVAAASDPADSIRFMNAFAKRGAGYGARAPDRHALDHHFVVESFQAGNVVAIESIRLDDSDSTCDGDGILDMGEIGWLTVTVRNVGSGPLGSVQLTLSNGTGDATFSLPAGNLLWFPQLQRGQAATIRIQVALASVASETPRGQLILTLSGASFPGGAPQVHHTVRVHQDLLLGTSARDDFSVESLDLWTVSPAGAWTLQGDEVTGWRMHADNASTAGEQVLVSPWLHVNPSGDFSVQLDHRWSFELQDGMAWDGGVLELTTDGLTWFDPFVEWGISPGYTAYLVDGSDNPLAGRGAFTGANNGFPGYSIHSVNFGERLAGQAVRVRFRVGTDGAVGAWGWDIRSFGATGISNTPFGSSVAQPASCGLRPVAHVPAYHALLEGVVLPDGTLQRNTVVLDGSGSFAPSGAALSYTWTQVAGPPLVLTDANTATPSFVADVARNTVYAFQLVVDDGVRQSQPRTTQVTVVDVDRPAVALATAPAAVEERSTAFVTLDGSGSSDPDGNPLVYAWSQLAGPEVALLDADAAVARFALPEVEFDTSYTFALRVHDGGAWSAPALVTVTVLDVDRMPTAFAGPDRSVAGRTLVTLAGSASDPDGDPVALSWTQILGVPVELLGADTATPTFLSPRVPAETTLVFQLTATARGQSASSTVAITVAPDAPPVVDAGSPQLVASRALVTLQGTASDPEGDAIALAWVQLAGPPVTLLGAETATPTFLAPLVAVETDLVFQLTATAGGLQAVDTVQVTVQAEPRPAADAGPDRTVPGRSTVVLRGSAHLPAGGTPTFAWVQLAGPAVALTGAESAVASFTSPHVAAPTTLVFRLTVAANGLEVDDTVAITVEADRAPVVDAGSARTVPSRMAVTLHGTASDPEGDEITWQWTQLTGPAVDLAGADSPTPGFTAPSVLADETLTFRATVEAEGLQASADVSITVLAEPVPLVDAGADATVAGRSTVLLRGSADAAGAEVQWAWSQVDGPAVTLAGADASVATFTAPVVQQQTVLRFLLTVTAHGQVGTDTVSIAVLPDGAPTVSAGPDLLVDSRAAVLLRAEAADPEGDPVALAWTQLEGPAVVLAGAETASAGFTAPSVVTETALHFRVTAVAGGLVATDEVVVVVRAEPLPVVDAGADQQVAGRTRVVLRGDAVAPAGGTLALAWTQLAGPDVVLQGADAATATFHAPDLPAAAVLVFQLEATANGQIATDTVSVTVAADGVPVADAGADQEVAARSEVTLRGTAFDPDGDPLAFSWTQLEGPAVELRGADGPSPYFTAPDVATGTTLVFELVATANGRSSAPATVAVRVVRANRKPVAEAPPLVEVDERTLVVLEAAGTDPDGDELRFRWEQVGGPLVETTGADTAVLAFTAPAVADETLLAFALVAVDGDGAASEPVVARVLVRNVDRKRSGDGGGGCAAGGAGGAAGPSALLLVAAALLGRRRR